MDHRGDFLHDRIVPVVLQDRHHSVIGRIGGIFGIGQLILGIEFPRLGEMKQTFSAETESSGKSSGESAAMISSNTQHRDMSQHETI